MVDHTKPATPSPSPEDRKQIERMVAECIEAMERGEPDPAARVCTEHPALLTRVQRRLAQLASRGLIPATDQLPPAAIGPYRIVRELGSGGMGSVYLAEQSEPVRREVALKVVKLGMDTREVVARFQAERQALARMNHPHIAQVFDAGITADGRPYFVMEYVAGQSLTTFCDRRSFDPEQRLRLFATVCRAVQHAHDRGFIHRDLKPSNILVVEHEGQMVPKVIDFGIAKATSAGSDSELRTRADQVLGTPEYMSPEQAITGGLDVDTRSDVYSLGAILYELLCGELPFDSRRLRRASRLELERILQDELPTTPSRRLRMVGEAAVSARGGERTSVHRRVNGELDWITLKALAKQREQRYPSALAFAEDIERWLQHEPVLAAPPGAGYRLRKFVRRHRVALFASVAVLLSLVTGLAFSLAATGRARDAEQRATAALDDVRAFYGLARDAVGNLVDIADKRLTEVPQAEPVRREMLDDAIRFYRGLREHQPSDPSLRIDIVAANHRVGELQRRLGQTTEALATLQGCVADASALVAAQPTDAHARALAIEARGSLARALSGAGHDEQSRATIEAALADVAAARALPDAPDLDLAEAGLLANLAIESEDDDARCADLFRRAITAFGRAAERQPGDPDRQRELARCEARYAQHLTRGNHLTEAADALAKAAARLRALPAEASANLRETEGELQDQFAGTLRRLARPAEARAAQLRANSIFHTLAIEHPAVITHGDNEAAGLHFLADLAEDAGEPAQARDLVQQAVAIRERLVAEHPQDHRLRMRLVRSIYDQANLEIALWQHHGGDVAAADATMARATTIVDELFRDHGDDEDVVSTFTAVHGGHAALLTGENQHEQALREHLAVRDALEAALAKHETSADLHGHLAMVESNLVQAYYLAGKAADAVAAGKRGMQHLERGLQLDARQRGLLDCAANLVGRLSIAQAAAGDDEGADATLIAMCEHREWGTDTRERGCLMLAQRVGEVAPGKAHDALVARAVKELQTAIAERGDLAAALARPAQTEGFSHVQSRLRDYDLRTALADLLPELDRRPEQAALLQQAVAIDATCPVDTGRARNLFAQRTELALAERETKTAAGLIEELQKRVGPDGRAFYMSAVLFCRCVAQTEDAALREHYAARATECLRLSLEKKEVDPSAARHPSFTPLQGRPDYEALLR